MLRFAMISKWHVHAQMYSEFVLKQPDAMITCVWDEDPERGRVWAQKLYVKFVADLDTLLARDDVDAVLVDTPTNMHKEVIIKAAKAKKHIFTEKVLAFTCADCDEIIRRIRENNVTFTISFPHRSFARNLYVKEMILSGALGKITTLRIRNCHDGAVAGWLPEYWYDPITTGGGAMMDLGAHGMYLANWLLGKPKRIVSTFANLSGHLVEDNSVCVMEFENSAIAITETSLVSPLSPVTLEVYGTKGVIQYSDDDVRVRTLDNQEWTVPQLPEELPHPIRQFIDSVLYAKPVNYGVEEARMLSLMMEKAYIADSERREVAF